MSPFYLGAVMTQFKEPARQESIMAHLREQIVNGTLVPGARLPTRVELSEVYDTTVVTVQRAISKLMGDGYVTAKRACGTFVSMKPPHLSNYAMVFVSHPVDSQLWGNLWQALVDESATISRAGARKVNCYYDVNGHPDGEDFQKLLRDVERERLAGVIFAGGPNPVITHPVLERQAVPRIAISSPIAEAAIPTIWPDVVKFVDRAVEHLAHRGRKAPAICFQSCRNSHYWQREQFRAAVERHGMRHKPKWIQFVDVYDREAAARVVQAVMDRDQTDPPDSLIVTDDTMLESAAAGVGLLDLRVPAQIDVIGHCNFPYTVPTAVPVTRLGYDLRGIMRACIDSIDRQRRGEVRVAEHIDVPARFEHEIEQTPAPVGAVRR